MKNNSSSQDVMSGLSQLETSLNEVFGQKAPQLPKGIKDFVVMITPYGTILSLIFAIPAAIALLGFGTLFAPLAMMSGRLGISAIVSLVALILTIVLDIMAVPGLFKKQKSAWDKLFWISLVRVVTTLVSGQWISLILGTAITWYFLFQVRSYYK